MHYIGDILHHLMPFAEFRYSKIFILPPWEEIYVSDEARYENYEQAKLIQNHLIETYKGFIMILLKYQRHH
jgi:predicted ATPase